MRHRLLPLLCLCLCPVLAQAAGPGKTISMFDGKTLAGWDGDPRFWSVKDGAITGATTVDNPTEHNTFLIWRAGTPSDFELEADFRLVAHNSGIQYRSREVAKWVMSGYQADFDATGKYTGILYEEKARGILALRGQKVVIDADGKRRVVGKTCDEKEVLASIKNGGWNHYRIVAKGNHLLHQVNGFTTVDVTDNQVEKRSMKGLIGFQVHQGKPMQVQFKNIVLKPLANATPESISLFNGKDLSGWTFQTDAKDVPMEDVWSVKDGILCCTGRPAGYLRTASDDYHDYMVHVEWRWPGKGGNNGVLVHASSPHALGVWPKSIEVQLESGNAGDFWVIGTELDVANETQRKKGRRHLNLTDDSEKPLGQWNVMEITCRGDEVTVTVNGDLVNHATHCNVTKGAICLQSEGTPIEFRKVELTPLK